MEQLNKTKSSKPKESEEIGWNQLGNILQLFREALHIASISHNWDRPMALRQTGCSLKIRIQPNMPSTKEEMKFLPQDKQS